MVDEPKIRLSKELADIIDKYRESLSREEFIDLCVKTFLREQGSVVPEPEVEPPQEEKVIEKVVARMEERKERQGPATVAVQHGPVVQQEIRQVKYAVPQTGIEGKEFPGARYINDSTFIMLWLAAVGFYGLGDLVTTNYALQLGLVEANPIAALFRNIVNMALFKVATIIAAFLISYTVFNTKTLIFSAPVMMLIAGAFLTMNNIAKILHVI
jgi:hypothetical protein